MWAAPPAESGTVAFSRYKQWGPLAGSNPPPERGLGGWIARTALAPLWGQRPHHSYITGVATLKMTGLRIAWLVACPRNAYIISMVSPMTLMPSGSQ